MMETTKSFFERISTQLALYLVCTGVVIYWLFQFLGIGFLLGVIFGVLATLIIQVYLALKLFNYEDYMRKSAEIENNRAYWNDRVKNYHQIRDNKFSFKMVLAERGEANSSGDINNTNKQKEMLKVASDGKLIIEDEKLSKEKLIEKSLLDLNDNYSNIMLSSGHTPMELMRKESLKVLNKYTHKNEDENFEVQYSSRLKNIESFVRYFITYLEKVMDVENQITFKTITDQRARYKVSKRKTFDIFKKGSKWVQLRYIVTKVEQFHQQNAVFISNGVKGQFEAFLVRNNEKFNEFRSEYENLKHHKYEALNQMDELTKKHKQSKENLEEVLLQYEQAKKEMTKYDRMLEIEMKAKLAQKAVQDEASNVLATKDQIKELRDEMKKASSKYIFNLTLAYKDKLEVFSGVLFSLINAFSDLCAESVNMIDDVLVQDQAESNAQETFRESLVKRSITNVKYLLEKASPNRPANSLTQLLHDNKRKTKYTIKSDIKAFQNVLKTTTRETYQTLNSHSEINYTISALSKIFRSQGAKYSELSESDSKVYNQETNLCHHLLCLIFEHLHTSFAKFSSGLEKYVESAYKDNEETKLRIDEIKCKCELEDRLLNNELDNYEKIEDKIGKDQAHDAFEILNSRYTSFRQSYIDNIEEIKSFKDLLDKTLDDLRYTLIDDLRTFYEAEIEKLVELQSQIGSDPDMARLNKIINSIDEKDDKLIDRVKSFINGPNMIKSKEPKVSENYKDMKIEEDKDDSKVHMALKVGNISASNSDIQSNKSINQMSPKKYTSKVYQNSQENDNELSDDCEPRSLIRHQKSPREKYAEGRKFGTLDERPYEKLDEDDDDGESTAQKVRPSLCNKFSDYKFGQLKQDSQDALDSDIEIISINESVGDCDHSAEKDDIVSEIDLDKELLGSQNGDSEGEYFGDKNEESEKSLPEGLESAEWLNQAIMVVYSWYSDKKSEEFTHEISQLLHKVFNDEDKPDFLDEIKVLDLKIGGTAPHFFSFQKLNAEPHEFLGDLDLTFRGQFEITVSTEIHLSYKSTDYALIPVTLKVSVTSLTGKIRLFLTQNFERMNWFSFVGYPNFKFDLDIIFGKDNKLSVSIFPKIKQFVEDLIRKQLHKATLPNKIRIEMPFFPKQKLMY